ncbi:FMN-binding negative transcriptional regulator [Psychromarinibacter sp. C21-152]|uniref:FMN-binding negative transcriptional regulator n=1 Tax=Psychromarinibacter sediminicola TaxID=3033385 RepID=A0AAE3NP24_9RHOB|nr:FMN-binding negative transcriptional regulator [Psychromarinibacter sediminicola]MDF0599382.1 FMN-binding negative transcriptional regulator [Psychromarinibacter sediminicola]
MHPNPAFRTESRDRNVAVARDRGFGTLAVNGDPAPLLSHVPFLLSEDGASAELHLVRSNPIVAACGESAGAVLSVQGPDGYVSPDWYGIADQVPTWNYIAVHLRGRLERRPEAELRPMLDRLSAHFEARLTPKPPWRSAKMPQDTLARMMRMVVPFVLHVDSVDGTWKLSQNKPDDARLSAADAMGRTGIGSETAALAAMMTDGAGTRG